ncbi:MAG: Xaa-Pro peptidase family protein [Candidatus Eisenbacteria bacterium]|nr:Xaa-Pro peptidase family protein [Candidatus Eisenbacteria bacterium]
MGRVKRARRLLKDFELDCLLIPPSADLLYLTGIKKTQSERLFLFVVPRKGIPCFLAPTLEKDFIKSSTDSCLIFTWEDGKNPIFPLVDILEAYGSGRGRTAVGDELWSCHQLEMTGVLRRVQFVSASPVMSRLRSVKEPAELQLMRKAARLTENVLASTLRVITPGMREEEIAAIILDALGRSGLDEPWAIVASGPNSAIPHHNSGARKLRRLEPLLLDIGGTYKGYNSDITRTYHVGPPERKFLEIYGIVLEANRIGRAKSKPSVKAFQIDSAVRDSIDKRGFGEFFTHRTGHGIGLRGHEEPYIVNSSAERLRRGMTFSIEPGIYIPGRFGVRIEDIVALTDKGSESLTRFSRALRIL